MLNWAGSDWQSGEHDLGSFGPDADAEILFGAITMSPHPRMKWAVGFLWLGAKFGWLLSVVRFAIWTTLWIWGAGVHTLFR